MGQDGEMPIKGVVLSGQDQDIDGVLAGDHDNGGEADDPDSEIEALGQALINAILNHAPPEDVQKLLDEDEAPLWYQDEDGWSALHAAASVEDPELVKDLLQRGAPWNSGERRALSLILPSHALHPLIPYGCRCCCC
jgi:ankyrin repeat protein